MGVHLGVVHDRVDSEDEFGLHLLKSSKRQTVPCATSATPPFEDANGAKIRGGAEPDATEGGSCQTRRHVFLPPRSAQAGSEKAYPRYSWKRTTQRGLPA